MIDFSPILLCIKHERQLCQAPDPFLASDHHGTSFYTAQLFKANEERWPRFALSRLDSAKLQCTAPNSHQVLLNLVKPDSVKSQVKEDSEEKLPKYVPHRGMTDTAQIFVGQQLIKARTDA